MEVHLLGRSEGGEVHEHAARPAGRLREEEVEEGAGENDTAGACREKGGGGEEDEAVTRRTKEELRMVS